MIEFFLERHQVSLIRASIEQSIKLISHMDETATPEHVAEARRYVARFKQLDELLECAENITRGLG